MNVSTVLTWMTRLLFTCKSLQFCFYLLLHHTNHPQYIQLFQGNKLKTSFIRHLHIHSGEGHSHHQEGHNKTQQHNIQQKHTSLKLICSLTNDGYHIVENNHWEGGLCSKQWDESQEWKHSHWVLGTGTGMNITIHLTRRPGCGLKGLRT